MPSSTTAESANYRGSSHTREVFVAPGRGKSPLREPTPPDDNSVDERLSSISPDVLPVPNETDIERVAREKKNK
jgi:hypothetical protein